MSKMPYRRMSTMLKMPNIVFNIDKLIVHMLMPSQEAPTENGDLGVILKGMDEMSKELDDLTREVQENNDVVGSATAMIEGLAQQIRDMKDDPAALAALASQLDAQSNALAEAVAANTPAEEPPVE